MGLRVGWVWGGESGGGGWEGLRVGAWCSRGGVVVGLRFEGGEEGGEAVFGDGAAWWDGCHWDRFGFKGEEG